VQLQRRLEGGSVLSEIKVPTLAESVTEATLVKWLKNPGEPVQQGIGLVEIETDKVMLEVPAPETGILIEIKKGDNETVVTDEVIGIIDTDQAALDANEPQDSRVATARSSASPSQVEPPTLKLSPTVRKLLAEHDLKPIEITSRSSDERITKADVFAHLASKSVVVPDKPIPLESESPLTPPLGERNEKRVPMTRLRRRIAERLLAAQHENAILTTFNEVDMQSIIALRQRYRSRFEELHGVRLGYLSFFVLAAVEALKRFPVINASIEGDVIVYHDYYNIGIAVSSPRGLVVPVLRDVDRLSAAQIESAIIEFARKARDNTLDLEDLAGGTFTITNGGIFGSLLSTPILNPPQSAIIGMHKIQDRPVVKEGHVVVRPMMYLALSYDHRLIDGREAVQFLVTLQELIEDPIRLLLEV
jgi:2-oxoglutarate dehydrogenase E2 component (dihydrolipoamide succinyltransferase)